MCEFGALNSVLIVFQWFTLNLSSILIIKMKLKKLITENEVKTKQFLFTKTFNQRADEQQKSYGGSLWNAQLDEVPLLVVVVEECFESSLFLRIPHLHLL